MMSCVCCKNVFTPPKINFNTSILENGDVVYRLGDTFYSQYFKDFSKRDSRYSHTGIVLKSSENDSIYVLHAEADDATGLGEVRKEPIALFFKQAIDGGAYRWQCSKQVKQNFVKWALHYNQLKIPFDMAFNCSDSSAFYCTEFVSHCINNAFNKEIIKANTLKNGKPFIAIDDTYLIENVTFIGIKSEK
jgi:hypothetical protein